MHSFSTSLFFSALTLLPSVLCSPNIIPISRSSTSPRLTRPDGTVSLPALDLSVQSTKLKYLAGRAAYQDNHDGRPIPGTEKVRDTKSAKREYQRHARERRARVEGLTPKAGAAVWSGPMMIGNQQFNIDFDTGSADLWVPSIYCNRPACRSKHRYNTTSNPPSARYPSAFFSIEYADGSGVSGPIFASNISVAGAVVQNQNFSGVTSMETTLDDIDVDGILGLAYAGISNMQSVPVFQNTWATNRTALDYNLFSFALSNDPVNSELCWGCINPARYSGSITYVPVFQQAYWRIGSAKLSINSQPVLTGQRLIVDTGTTLIYAPNGTVAQLFAGASGVRYYQDGYWSAPCLNIPVLSISFGDGSNAQSFPISQQNMNLGRTEEDRSRCLLAVVGQAILGKDILLGDAFLKNVYTVFSFGANAVGFAALPGVVASSPTPRLTRPRPTTSSSSSSSSTSTVPRLTRPTSPARLSSS